MHKIISLSPDTLISAYCQGIFPMADEQGRLNWYEADPRGILPPDRFHIPHDLKRILRQGRFRVTLDTAFEQVIRGCAERPDSTWISQEIIEAYSQLHYLGYAHSVESWAGEELAGGLYGVAIGGAFFGESMFYRRRDASKVALCYLARWLRDSDFALLDIQMVTDLLQRFGAVYISKSGYRQHLKRAIQLRRTLRAGPVEW